MQHGERAWLESVRRELLQATPELAAAETREDLAREAVNHLRRLLDVKVAAALFDDPTTPVFVCSIDPSVDDVARQRNAMIALCTRAHNDHEAVRLDIDATTLGYAIGLRSRDGRAVGALAISEPARGDRAGVLELLGHFGHIVGAVRDNVALHSEALRAVQARDDVMAIVTHDLRAPLGNIRVGASLLRDTADAVELPILARIDRSVTHLTSLVDDLVDMVRIDGGSLDIARTPERVAEIFETVAGIVTPIAEAARVDLRFGAVAPGQTVFADRHRVVQVLTNLIGNALKFTPAGGSVEVASEQRATDTTFRVRDTGRGISAAEQDHVFTRYWRSDAKRRRGLGLGLYIAKGVVEAHAGRIAFESKVGLGTTFVFTIPNATAVVAAAPEPIEPELANAPRVTPVAPGWRALVADDDEDMRYLIASSLRRAGFCVTEHANGRELVDAFDRAPTESTVIVSDIGMPEVDGIEATAQLRCKQPRPTIVLVTAFGDRATLQKAKAAGADRVLLKPVDIPMLVQTILALTRPAA